MPPAEVPLMTSTTISEVGELLDKLVDPLPADGAKEFVRHAININR